MTTPRGPLSGVKVVELATVIMGPYGGQLLGDLGADVLKIETDRGDGSRVMGGGPHPELSGIALNLHRNKQSISIDMKHPDAGEIVDALLRDADVFLTNLRPEPLRRLGLDYESLASRHPRLVHCQAQGFASDTEESARPAYDDIIQALAGFPQLNGLAFGETRFLPSIIVDKVAGQFIAQGVLAALFERERSGQGQSVEVPMFDAGLAFNLVEHLAQGAVPGGAPGYNRSLTPNRGPHRTVDGYVAMMPYTDGHWQALFDEVGEAHLLDNPIFEDTRSRLDNADEVYGLLAAIVKRRTTDEWLTLCERRGIPVAPVPDLAEIVDDETHHRGVLVDAEHPTIGQYRQVRAPIRFSRSGQRDHGPAPLVAEHTRSVLSRLGFDADRVDGWVSDGVVAERPSSHPDAHNDNDG